MPATTRDAVLRIAPELTSIGAGDARWAQFITDATLSMSSTVWGTLYEMGMRYLVAHRMTVSVRSASGASGEVLSESVGGISRTYRATTGGPGDLSTTHYGAEYKQLQRIVAGGPRV